MTQSTPRASGAPNKPPGEGATVDGVLYGATVEDIPGDLNGRKWARGVIYGDRKGRFDDGEAIRTSYIVSGPDENGIIHTRNSIYRLVSAAHSEPAPKAGCSPADLEALEGLLKAATQGEWLKDRLSVQLSDGTPIATAWPVLSVPGQMHANADLIVAAVNALPQLLAAARRPALPQLAEGYEWVAQPVSEGWPSYDAPPEEGSAGW